jgi:hypothetical protein
MHLLAFPLHVYCHRHALFFFSFFSFSFEKTKAFILGLITAQIDCIFSFLVSCFFLENKECLLFS